MSNQTTWTISIQSAKGSQVAQYKLGSGLRDGENTNTTKSVNKSRYEVKTVTAVSQTIRHMQKLNLQQLTLYFAYQAHLFQEKVTAAKI